MFQKGTRLILISLLFVGYNAFGQGYYNYVSRFSQPAVYGTARMQALGGTGIALGADLSSAAMNPGGLGMYNKSDMGGSIGIGLATSNATYTTTGDVTDNRDSRGWFSIPNLGVSFYNESRNSSSAFKGGSFAITYNKVSNFQNQIGYAGLSNRTTMIDDFVENTNNDPSAQSNIASDQFTSGPVQTPSALYYYSNLVTGPGGSNFPPYGANYPYPISESPFQQLGSVTTRKGQYLWNLAYGANFFNKLYVGASVGISVLNYKLQTQHEEVVQHNSDPAYANNLVSFLFEENDQHRSTSVNLKVGGIYKVTDRFRVAFTALTPTQQMVRETYVWSINSQFNTSTTLVNNDIQLAPQYYRYRYVAPPRFEWGATYVFNKSGLVTLGAEYVPYTWASLKDPSNISTFRQDNKNIKDFYRNTLNFKGGLELRSDIFYYRVGCAYMPDPYKNTFDNINRDQWNFTAGWGVRTSSYYFDIAAVNTRFGGIYRPYVANDGAGGNGPSANYKSSIVQFTLTAGILY